MKYRNIKKYFLNHDKRSFRPNGYFDMSSRPNDNGDGDLSMFNNYL